MKKSSKAQVYKYHKGQVLKSRSREHIYIDKLLDTSSQEGKPQYAVSYYSSSPEEEFISSSVVSESNIDEQTVKDLSITSIILF